MMQTDDISTRKDTNFKECDETNTGTDYAQVPSGPYKVVEDKTRSELSKQCKHVTEDVQGMKYEIPDAVVH